MKICFLFLLILFSMHIHAQEKIYQIETMIQQAMANGQIPGLSLVVINNGKILLQKGYGNADLKKHLPVTSQTLFELGSTTKAFTGLAILKLAKEGKINLTDSISNTLPWFYAIYKGKKVDIRIQDCLFHTSGIPFQTIVNIPESTAEDALEKTIKNLIGIELVSQPSQQFQYATINYDILGLIIQTVTQQSYETYMLKEILSPLNLTHSYLNRQLAYQLPPMANGYKIEFLAARSFFAPTYRGNTPAGYLIANIEDVSQWLLHQLNPTIFKDLILQSHEANPLPTFSDQAFYAAGWFLIHTDKGNVLSHPGNNPNFSSYFAFSPEHQAGVAVLANINSNYVMSIGQFIISLLIGQELENSAGDIFQNIDLISTSLLAFASLIIMGQIYLFVRLWKEIYSRQRRFYALSRLFSLFGTFILLIFLAFSLAKLPDLLMPGFSWQMLNIWGPHSLLIAIAVFYVILILGIIYIQFRILFPKRV